MTKLWNSLIWGIKWLWSFRHFECRDLCLHMWISFSFYIEPSRYIKKNLTPRKKKSKGKSTRFKAFVFCMQDMADKTYEEKFACTSFAALQMLQNTAERDPRVFYQYNKLFLFTHLTHLQMWILYRSHYISFIVLLVRTPRKRAFSALTLTTVQSQARCVVSCREVQRGAWQCVGAKEVLAGGGSFATTPKKCSFRMILTYQNLRKETNSFTMQHTSNFMFDNMECWELATEWILPVAFSRKSKTII